MQYPAKPELVKYLLGLRLAQRGILSFAEAAKRIGVSAPHVSNVVACREKSPRIQLALAKLSGCKPEELFGAFTHSDLRSPNARKETAA